MPCVVNEEHVLRPHLYLPQAYDDPQRREQIACLWARDLSLLGSPNSEVHVEKSRIVAERGKIVTGLLTLQKEVRYEGGVYRSLSGGSLEGEVWEIHAENVRSHLGTIEAKHLWLDVLNHYYSSGVTKAGTLVLDVQEVTLDREQREWTITYTVETRTKKKNVWGHAKEKSHWQTHTATLRESYPEDLSGVLAFEAFIGGEDQTPSFPHRLQGREQGTLTSYGGKIVAQEGWTHQMTGDLKLLSKQDASSRPYAISHKGHSKHGRVTTYTSLPSQIEVLARHLELKAKTIHLEGTRIQVLQGRVRLEASDILKNEHAIAMEALLPYYYQQKKKIHEVGGWQEVHTPTFIRAQEIVLKAGQEIWGHTPKSVTPIEYEAPFLSLTSPIPHRELYDVIIGQIRKGNAGFAMVVGFAATLGTLGAASPVVMAAFLGEIGGVIGSAMVASVAGQTASSLVMHEGHLKHVGKDLTSTRFARSLAITAASAGLMHTLSQTFTLPVHPKGFTQHLQTNAVRSVVSAGLNMTIGGVKPQEALLEGLKSCLAHTAGGWMSGKIGDAFDFQKINEIEHLLAHAGSGALSGLIISIGEGDLLRGMASGGIGAMAAEFASVLFSQGLKGQEQDLLRTAQEEGRSLSSQEIKDFNQSVQMRADMAKVIGAFSSFIVGQDVGIASLTASNAVDHNYVQHVLYTLAAADVVLELYSLTHPEEAEAYKQAAIHKVAEKTGFSPEGIEESLQGLLLVGGTIGGKGASKLLKGLGATFFKSEMGKSLFKDGRIRKINNRMPINAEYAGKIYPLEKLPIELRQKYPHSVPFTGTGHPDFSRYAVKKVEIKMIGDQYMDRKQANKISGYQKTPKGYTWHHHHDGKNMHLVPKDIHEAVDHTGGAAIVKSKK